MKKYFFNLLICLSFLSSSEIWASSSEKISPNQKDYYFFNNDHSQVITSWVKEEEVSLSVIMQSLGTYFKKAAENKDSLQDQILLAAQTLQSWFSGMAKSIDPSLHLNTEVGFVPGPDKKHFSASNADAAMAQTKEQLKEKKDYLNYTDDELNDLAIAKMPKGFDSKISSVQDYILSNHWPSPEIQVVAGDVLLFTVSDRIRVIISMVLSLPKVTYDLHKNLSGYALFDYLTIPSSNDGHSPVYAILNLELTISSKDLKLSQDGDIQLPFRDAKLKVEFANNVKVTSGNKLSSRDNRMVTFSPLRSGGDFKNSTLTDTYVPTERLPYLRAKNIIPKGKVWKPLEKFLGPDGFFDFGFVNLYSFEMDLIKLEALSLNGRLEFYNRPSLNNRGESADKGRGGCLTIQDQDHCASWKVNSGDYLEQYFLKLANKYLDTQKQSIRSNIKQKFSELAAIVSGSYQAYQVRRDSDGNYSEFSENMLKDLCQDGTLDSSDEQCRTIGLGRNR